MTQVASSLDQARHWLVRYRKRQVIYDEGEESSAIFRLVSGCVRLQVNGLQGHRQIVGFLFPGDIFGLCVEGRASAAEAVTDVELTHYSLESVLQLSTQSNDLFLELMRTANTQFGDLAHHLAHVTHMPAPERVLWFFNWLAHRQGRPGGPVTLPMTRRDIGDFLALSPETLSRVIHNLQAQGVLVRRGPRAFALHRPAAQGPREEDAPERPRALGGTGPRSEVRAI